MSLTMSDAAVGTTLSALNPSALSASEDSDLDVTLPCQVSTTMDLWFAEGGADVERAKSMCTDCPLRAQCLDGALERREPWGVWGGEVLVDGAVVARKRGRGRPRKIAA
ncbi:WhiB family transcriptional regulator [Serinibacter arcticus]|uniref:Transcriptional regulator WhiB n=1 Tax=Serinibacter arcticus TaxID=1655435 RepID=A0A4Z1E2D5_9MICO|nr:WhiB family transcriptional regulator [Serinibacter arcticus]TGO06165.1 WhiB-family transcriptional regulator [Serinibacter arcticus]